MDHITYQRRRRVVKQSYDWAHDIVLGTCICAFGFVIGACSYYMGWLVLKAMG